MKGNLAFQGELNVSLVSGSPGATTSYRQVGDDRGQQLGGGKPVRAIDRNLCRKYCFFGDRNGNTSNNNNISGCQQFGIQRSLVLSQPEGFLHGRFGIGLLHATQVIGDTITFSGSTTINQNSCSTYGVTNILASNLPTKISLSSIEELKHPFRRLRERIEMRKMVRRANAGMAAIEFAVIVPCSYVLLMGAVDMGQMLFAYYKLDQAVASGSQYAVLNCVLVNSTSGTTLANNIATIVEKAADGTAWATLP